MAAKTDLLLAYYGDDFTGSTDALEFLSRAGIKTVLFIQPPSRAQLAKYPDLRAIGVAGMTRSMPPAKMEEILVPAFEALNALKVRHVHYKVCSTFDSSPAIGSIGKAIDVGCSVFRSSFVPLLVAAPALGRYCAFGNLFARMGIGSDGQIFRLDRHPSMSKHPVTPADESDLRLHLSKQTYKTIGLLDILQIANGEQQATIKLQNLIDEGNEVVLFDAIYEDQLFTIGQLIDNCADEKTLFSVGSSGIEMALGEYWNAVGTVSPQTNWEPPGKASPLLVLSGSCSPVTAGQIKWAINNGFAEIAIDTAALANSGIINENIAVYINKAAALLELGVSVIVHTSRGNDDVRVAQTNMLLTAKGFDRAAINSATSSIYGTALGAIAKQLAERVSLQRILLAGGDTSSFAARAMGIEAVELLAPLAPGAPLCKAHAPGSPVDGLEINFKGGQVGGEDYFQRVLNGEMN